MVHNEDIPEINNLRSSVQAKFIPLKSIVSSTQDILGSSKQIAIEDKTVQELLELDLFDCEGMQFACTVTITRLSPGQRWWFPSCLLCHKTSIPTGSVYRCSDLNCSSTNAEPKYRISLLASYGTTEAEFVLFGRIAQQIIQKPLLALLRTDRPIHEPIHEMVVAARATQGIPSAIATIVTQKYRFIVSITEKSFLRKQPSFQVHRIDTYFGKQLHSPLFDSTYTPSHPTSSRYLAYPQ